MVWAMSFAAAIDAYVPLPPRPLDRPFHTHYRPQFHFRTTDAVGTVSWARGTRMRTAWRCPVTPSR
jgi:hypothetical protein